MKIGWAMEKLALGRKLRRAAWRTSGGGRYLYTLSDGTENPSDMVQDSMNGMWVPTKADLAARDWETDPAEPEFSDEELERHALLSELYSAAEGKPEVMRSELSRFIDQQRRFGVPEVGAEP